VLRGHAEPASDQDHTEFVAGTTRGDAKARWDDLVPAYQELAASIASYPALSEWTGGALGYPPIACYGPEGCPRRGGREPVSAHMKTTDMSLLWRN
jgi:hypothetical protein